MSGTNGIKFFNNPQATMKESPLLFSTPMVQATLEGRKTQTRRILKVKGCKPFMPDSSWSLEDILHWTKNYYPYGKPGDLIWVRETYQIVPPNLIFFKADKTNSAKNGWKPSIFMPKAAARIWLQVVSIRPERLHDIREEDAIAEGVEFIIINNKPEYRHYEVKQRIAYCINPVASYSFKTLWRSINGRDSWEANPWVWRIEFKVLSTTGKPSNIERIC